MRIFNCQHFKAVQNTAHTIVTDASQNGGGAILDNTDWLYLDWQLDLPQLHNEHINIKETLTVIYALFRWAPWLSNSTVTVWTDNITARAALNKCACHNEVIMDYMRILFWLANVYNFEVICKHIPGKDNVYSDTISRLRIKGPFLFWFSLCNPGKAFDVELFNTSILGHMSDKCVMFFNSQVHHLVPWWQTWMKE